MKHLIAFLGYTQSRIQHPVYRQFVQAPIARRNATLLFHPRPLEERELVHEINELRRREGGPCELTFHLCATFDNPLIGQQIVQTAIMIHRLYDCPSYVYCQMPDLANCSDVERNNAWKCLTAINNGVNDYPHLRLISHCFLYQDPSQRSLARFLFHVTREPEALDFLERFGYMGKLLSLRRSGDISYVPEFPSIFSTFNASGIEYPDEEIRYYIHQRYLNRLLQLSRPQFNPIDMERCNEHVSAMLSALPLSVEQVSLRGSEFIELPQSAKHRPWQPVEQYWNDCLALAFKDLEDRPREEWINQLKNSMDVFYQSRFREMGVDYFYQRQKKLTPDYCKVMLAQLREGLRSIMSHNPYPPETLLDITRSIVNHLQQDAFGFTREIQDAKAELLSIKSSVDSLMQAWDSLGFFDRMRGKDRELFDSYRQIIVRQYVLNTLIQSSEFAIKLLNEFIPQVAAIPDADNRLGQLCQFALDATQSYLDNNQPRDLMVDIFDSQPVVEAADAICFDRASLEQDFNELLSILYASPSLSEVHNALSHFDPLDSESLLQQLRDRLTERIDRRIHQRISDGTMTAVLDVNVTDRLSAIYAAEGGLPVLVNKLKTETALTLQLKGKGGRNEQYLLIAPECQGLGMPYVQSDDMSSVQMLHVITSISLTDLDGFAGQRMFVEPSMF